MGTGHDDLAAAAAGLALQARSVSQHLEEDRAALSRSALVWWEGGAAQTYEQLVRERAGALALGALHWAQLADTCEAIAAQARRAGGADVG